MCLCFSYYVLAIIDSESDEKLNNSKCNLSLEPKMMTVH